VRALAFLLATLGSVAACVSSGAANDANGEDVQDGGPSLDLGAVTRKDGGGTSPVVGALTPQDDGGAGNDGPPGGDGVGAGGPPPPDGVRFATNVVSFTPGRCAGFGQPSMPAIVLGPPQGGGDSRGSLDVVSLGTGGEIVVSFEPFEIVDGPGVDFLVFENAFYSGGDPTKPYVELGEVSVSEDGVTWSTFPCTATDAPPYGACAGWHPVYATGEIALADVAAAGGDPYDLAAIGVTRARFVRIKDKTAQRCTSQGPDTNGFDLDAVGIVHSARP
jgi:hypothetical protein